MHHYKKLMIIIPICALIGAAAYFILPTPVDWRDSYRPAALLMLSGHSPFEIRSFYNAPWILIPLIPLALLPVRMGGATLVIINILIIFWLGKSFKVNPIMLAISFPAFFLILYGQIDGLVLSGLLLPQWLGVVLLSTKPQIGLWVIVFYFYEKILAKEWRKVLTLFFPLVACFTISFLMYGQWMTSDNMSTVINFGHNSSLWPTSMMFGIPLLLSGYRQQNIRYVMMATPLLSPYVGPHSWLIALLAIPWPSFFILTCISSWSFLILWGRALGEVLTSR